MRKYVSVLQKITSDNKSLWREFIIGNFVFAILSLSVPLATRFIIDYGIIQGQLNAIVVPIVCVVISHMIILYVNFSKYNNLAFISGHLYMAWISNFLSHSLHRRIEAVDEESLKRTFESVNEFERVDAFLQYEISQCVSSLFCIVVMFPFLLWVSPKMALIFLAVALLYFVSMYLTTKVRGRLDEQRYQTLATVKTKQYNALQTTVEAQSWNSVDWLIARIQIGMGRFRQAIWDTRSFEASQELLANGISRTNNVLTLGIMSIEAFLGNISIGSMMAVVIVMNQLFYNLDLTLKAFRSMQDATLSAERVLVSTHETVDEPSLNSVSQHSFHEVSVSFRNVEIERNQKKILKKFDLEIQAGSFVAIMGKSGSGKSTLAKCLYGLISPTLGEVWINERKMTAARWRNLRNSAAFIDQGSTFFDGTLLDNIVLQSKVHREYLEQALNMAEANELVGDHGLASIVSPAAETVSFGQKQRLLLARAFYRRPSLMILDEAMNGLDEATEHKIVKRIREELVGTTRIMITHRQEAAMFADRILFMEDGALRESIDRSQFSRLSPL